MNLVFCENGLKPDGNVMMIWKMTIGRQLVKIIPDLGNYGLSCGKGIFFCVFYTIILRTINYFIYKHEKSKITHFCIFLLRNTNSWSYFFC